ncbi:MAG TPA: TspO/MBR family protein [Croceibacterium sp.]|nr:TspO/MBR family protein [Croceibacterium sp.]
MNRLASPAQLRASLLRWALVLVPAVLLLGFVSGQVAGSGPDNLWFAVLEKPSIYPPPAAFGIVWAILYVLMGYAAAMIASAWGARGRPVALVMFAIQLALNLAWSPVFFGLHRIAAALWVIVALDFAVLVTIVLFWRVRRIAGVLLLPYLAWTLFATALTWQFLALNPYADGVEVSGAVERIEL